MTNPRQLEKIRKGTRGVLIAAFIGLLWLPTLDSLFHLDKAPMSNENRAPAKFPALNLSLDGVRTYMTGLESYYNDHFGFRNQLVRWDHRWKHNWFKESSLSDVIIGREGWLFFCGERMIENYRGMADFKPKELQEWQALLEARRDWLAR